MDAFQIGIIGVLIGANLVIRFPAPMWLGVVNALGLGIVLFHEWMRRG